MHQDTSYALDSNYWRGTSSDMFFDENRRQIIISNYCGGFGEKEPRMNDKVSPALTVPQGGGQLPVVAQAIQTDGMLRTGCSWGTNIPQSARDIRQLTPKECERLQGFPDGWTDIVSDNQRYRQLGNAVTVNVVEAIGKQFCRTMDIDYVSKKEIKIGEMKSIEEWI